MATTLQLRRGDTTANNGFTGAAGELSVDTSTDNIRVHDGSTAGGFEIVPSGVILAFGGSSTPGNFLLCDGSDVSRTTYARLFAVIGTAFGVGDGSTTFGLPDLQDRVLLGKGTNNATLGTETGSVSASSVISTGASTTGGTTNSLSLTTATFASSAKDSATASAVTNVTNASHTHTIPALNATLPSSVVNFIIKT